MTDDTRHHRYVQMYDFYNARYLDGGIFKPNLYASSFVFLFAARANDDRQDKWRRPASRDPRALIRRVWQGIPRELLCRLPEAQYVQEHALVACHGAVRNANGQALRMAGTFLVPRTLPA